jgi:hypothetical protein
MMDHLLTKANRFPIAGQIAMASSTCTQSNLRKGTPVKKNVTASVLNPRASILIANEFGRRRLLGGRTL